MSLADEMMIISNTLSAEELKMMADQEKNNGHYKKLLLKYMDQVSDGEGVFFLDEDDDWQSELIKLWNDNNELQIT